VEWVVGFIPRLKARVFSLILYNEETTERVVCPVCDGQSDGFDECEFCGYVFAGEDGGVGDAQTEP
jgi:rubredoxin